MDPVLPVNTAKEATVLVDSAPAPNSAQRAVTRQVSGAVQQLNEIEFAGHGKEITFSIDRTSRLPVVKVVNTNTKEVVEQWPAEYVLQLAADYVEKIRESR